MKRFTALFLSLVFLSCSAAADPIDLSGMSFDELVALRDQLNLAIWNSQEWQEVTVPAGVWTIGEDIPAGHWTIKAAPETYTTIVYCDRLNASGTNYEPGYHGWAGTLTAKTKGLSVDEPREVDIIMAEGMYFINRGTVIFYPYSGKPDLGFR